MTMDLETLCGRYAKSIKRKTMFLADSELLAPFYSTSLNVKTASVVASALAFALDIINAKQAEIDANSHAITEIADALGDETFNSISQAATGIRDLQAELDALKADAARYRYIKRHVNQENEELGCPSGTEISFYEWDEVSGTGYDPSEYDVVINNPMCAYSEGSIECRNGFLYDAAGEYDPTDRSKPCPLCGEKAK